MTFYRNLERSFQTAAERLLKEIKENNEKIQRRNFLKNLKKMRDQFQLENRHEIAWLPKDSSFGLSRYDAPLQYLPSKAFYDFMHRGFYIHIKDDSRLTSLIRLYSVYIKFSEDSQQIEDKIHDGEITIDDGIDQIINLFNKFEDKFISRYKQFKPDQPLKFEGGDPIIIGIRDFFKKKSKIFYLIWFFLFFLVPYLLFKFHEFIVLEKIPIAISIKYFYLSSSDPNFYSMFLANYVHNPRIPEHFLNNFQVYLVVVLCIFILETIVFELIGIEREDGDFSKIVLIFFLIIPFCISGMSIFIDRIVGGTGSQGFSGIISAFLGYLFFLIYYAYSVKIREKEKLFSSQKIFFLNLLTLILLLIPVVFMIYNYYFPLPNSSLKDNLTGHITGYILGFSIPYLLTLKNKEGFDYSGVMLTLILILFCSMTIWMFV
jgi:hypothetical protein